jgi:hypothetical protein
VVASSGLAERNYSIDQPSDFFWTAVGVRGTSNWDLEVYGNASGGSYPVCLSGVLGSSALAAPTVDFVVANFNVADLAPPYYVRAHLNNDMGSGSGAVEWDDGGTVGDVIDAEGPPPTPTIVRTTGSNDVLECWDMYLTQGQSYRFFLNSSGPAVKAFLFSPTLAWGRRSDAILTVLPGTTAVSYVASATGFHGLVVVNDDGGAGTYDLRVYSPGVVAVGDASLPSHPMFTAVEPNPSHGSARIRFGLRQPGAVGFDVIDAAGRRVATVADRTWSAGQWSVDWNGRDANGARLPPGVYFVRMFLDRQPLGLKKLALLD